jgi:hypothetical protein
MAAGRCGGDKRTQKQDIRRAINGEEMTVTAKWDTAEVLNTRERVVAYLDAVLAGGDLEMLKLALGNIARSKGIKLPPRGGDRR